MRSDPTKHIVIDDRLEAYRPFFDHAWAKEIAGISEPHAKLDSLVFDLMSALKGISRTAALPHMAVGVAQSYSDGHQLESLENSLLLQVVLHIAERLDQNVVIRGVDRADIRKVMLALADQALAAAKGKSIEFPRQDLWDSMAKVVPGESDATNSAKNEFRISLWSVQRIAYSGMFFAYEDFLVRCLEIHSGDTIQNVGKAIRDIEDGGDNNLKSLVADCWRHPGINSAKEVRNSLSHSGGRETPKVKSCKHTVLVVDETLQLLPKDLVELFDLLKPRIISIAEWAAQQPNFS